jgi:hypothetical protein
MKKLFTPLVAALLVAGTPAHAAAPAAPATAAELNAMAKRFAPVDLTADTGKLSKGDRVAIEKLIEAAKIVDVLQLRQRWSGNEALWAALQKDTTPLGKARRDYFWLNKGPWSIIDGNRSFMPADRSAASRSRPRKPAGANFYPEGASKQELETWMNSLPPRTRNRRNGSSPPSQYQGRQGQATLRHRPYSDEYATELQQLSKLLKEAANATDNASLKKFLNLRADAFLSNDYLASDFAWMDLDSPVDVTIGPYETYNDELFGYKAAFEAYVNVRDAEGNREAELLRQAHAGAGKQPAAGSEVPQSEGRRTGADGGGQPGVRRRRRQHGRADRRLQPAERRAHHQQARLQARDAEERAGSEVSATLQPITKLVLRRPTRRTSTSIPSSPTSWRTRSCTAWARTRPACGKPSTPRQDLKDAYSTIEEAKADITGLWALGYMMDKGQLNRRWGRAPRPSASCTTPSWRRPSARCTSA